MRETRNSRFYPVDGDKPVDKSRISVEKIELAGENCKNYPICKTKTMPSRNSNEVSAPPPQTK